MQGTVGLLIHIEDIDLFGASEPVDDIFATIMLTPNSSFTSRSAYSGTNGNIMIELSFRLQCTSNFYGSDCATYCVPRDDSEGYYNCGPNGERICLSGWGDPSRNCTVCKL